MSSDDLRVEFPDGLVLYGIYYGTSDVLRPRLFPSRQEAWNAYNAGGHEGMCAEPEEIERAKADEEPVFVTTRYGSSDHRNEAAWNEVPWPVTASRTARLITGPLSRPSDAAWNWDW